MSRANSPQGRRRVRTIIGKSNRRQVLNPLSGAFEAPPANPTPGLDGAMFDGDLDSYMNQTMNTRTEETQFPKRANTAMSMLNTTIGYASACSIREEDVSWQWGAAQGGLFESTLGPDGGPRKSHSSMSHVKGAGRAQPWRRTDVTSVSVTLSPDPRNTRDRLTAATRTERLKNIPTASELLTNLSSQKARGLGDRSGSKGREGPVTGLCAVTPGPMVFDDPKFLKCPTLPNKKVAGAISKQLNAATDDDRQAVPVEKTAGNGVCANGAWVMKKPSGRGDFSPAKGGPNGMEARTKLALSPVRNHETPIEVLKKVPRVTNDPLSRLERTGYTKSMHVVQPDRGAATYASSAEQYNSTNRGLGASLDAQEIKLKQLASRQRRVERKAESHRQADLRAAALEQAHWEAKVVTINRKGEAQRQHEANAKVSTFKVPPPNSFQALMDP